LWDDSNHWQSTEEPYDGRLSSTVLWEAWGEIPLAYLTEPKLTNG
jgi:hypothetical protein